MNLSKVRMVVTDMDGTLLNSKSEVSSSFFDLFQLLKKLEVKFVAASGRQYSSIKDKLNIISEEITIVAENGGYIMQGENELDAVYLSNEKVQSLLPVINQADGLYTVLCGKNAAYIAQNEERFVNILKEYYTQFTIVEDFSQIPADDIFKVAIYHFESSESYIYPVVRHLEDQYQIKISGANWVDISNPIANKGRAVKILQDQFGISKDETMVFGDFNNDLEMLEQAYFSYAMSNAHDNVKKAARFQTKSNDELGVESILKELIESKKDS